MTEKLFYYFQIISTFSALVPLLIGLPNYKHRDVIFKVFIIFLLVGFVTDLLGWYFFVSKSKHGNIYTKYTYGIFEVLILSWIVTKLTSNKMMKTLFSKNWILLIPFWIFGIMIDEVFAAFRTTSQVLIAFGSCFCLLMLIEKQDVNTRNFQIWILLGLFFYFFSSFFFMSLLASQLGLKIWYGHNVINVFTNLIYAFGFWRTRSYVGIITSDTAPDTE